MTDIDKATACERAESLRTMLSRLGEVKDLAKRVVADYSFISEVDHLMRVVSYNLECEAKSCEDAKSNLENLERSTRDKSDEKGK